MRHRLSRHGDAAAELVRLTQEDLAAAAAELGGRAAVDRRIHSVRQHLKWVRSALRVLEGAVGEDAAAARREAGAAARLLASARDADVAAASARVLSGTTALANEAGFDRLADALDVEAAFAHQQRVPLAEVGRRLAGIADMAAGFSTNFDGDALIAGAILRAYRRSRRAMQRAAANRGTADLHAWRKEAKHLWHLVRLARARLPARTGKWAMRLHDLTELLGLDHDHAMLAERIALAPADGALPKRLKLIFERRGGIEDDAFDLGRRLFSAKPRRFARRWRLAG